MWVVLGSHEDLDPTERDRVLDAATALFAKHGPGPLTIKWVALDANVRSERVLAVWPTIESLLAEVLDRLASQFQGVDGRDLDDEERERENELIDTFQRIIARSLLDGFDTGSMLTSYDHVERIAGIFRDELGLDDRSARFRLAQGYALEWGWHLFGRHLKVACGLTDEPDDLLLAEVRRSEWRLARTPVADRDTSPDPPAT